MRVLFLGFLKRFANFLHFRRTDCNIGLISGGQAINALGTASAFSSRLRLCPHFCFCLCLPSCLTPYPSWPACVAAEAAEATLLFRIVTPPAVVLAQLEALVAKELGVRVEIITQNGTVQSMSTTCIS
jgi:hypothetical protein